MRRIDRKGFLMIGSNVLKFLQGVKYFSHPYFYEELAHKYSSNQFDKS